MTQEEQIRLYRLMEKLNWFFHQEMHYLDRETALVFPPRDALPGSGNGGKDRTRVLPGDSGFYIRYFME